MKKTTILSLVNQKGGVAKTTSTINLAAALSKLGKKVLVIDLDPQGNCTVGSGIDLTNLKYGTYNLLLENTPAEDCIIKRDSYDIIGTDIKLAGAELIIISKIARESLLKHKLDKLTGYDFILIDCPPSLSLLTVNALTASTSAYVPVSASVFAVGGITQLSDTIDSIKILNKDLEIKGVFLTRFDKREKFNYMVEDALLQMFEEKLLKTKIRVCADINKSQVQGVDIFTHNPKARSAEDYMQLAQEVIELEK
ncbi:ParA family protein [Cetobacterium sp. SF1]|uniref:ParA family protein n=1 Tax=Cetobacterium sp. SF1 TaxID=3417654 RepID=UPI003CE9E961